MTIKNIILAIVLGAVGAVMGVSAYGLKSRGSLQPLMLRSKEIPPMQQNEVGRFELTLANQLAEPVKIDSVESSCSCSEFAQDMTGQVVNPGAALTILGAIHSGTANGNIGSRIRIRATSKSGRTVFAVQEIIATVVPTIVVEPDFLDIGEIQRSETKEFAVDFKSEFKDFKIQLVRSIDLSFAVREVEAISPRHSRVWVVCAGAKIPKDQQTSYGSLLFRTDITESQLFELTCRLGVPATATVTPSRIVFTKNETKAVLRMEKCENVLYENSDFEVSADSNKLLLSSVTKKEDGTCEVLVELVSSAKQGEFQGVIVVGSRPSGLFSIDVPVAFFEGEVP